MKKIINILIVALIIAMAGITILPSVSYAFNNLIEIALMGGSGEITGDVPDADLDTSGFGFSYTKYFTALRSPDEKYSTRVFLQHPSYLRVALTSQGHEITVTGTPESIEYSGGGFEVDGMYYFEGGTGIGGSLRGGGAEEEAISNSVILNKDEQAISSLTLSVNHYFTDNISARADIISTKSEIEHGSGLKEEYEEGSINIGASALIKNTFWISGRLGSGSREIDNGPEFDTSKFMLEAGTLPIPKLGVFLGVEVDRMEGRDYDSTRTVTRLTLDYSASQKVNIKGTFIDLKEETTIAGTDENTELSALEISVGILF